ncbi:hypothetical protein CEQ48_01685 [Vibrio tarriae]|uniref:Uncharacterized protein n=1 Tax=Vibrio tarriae TaxID=2014742 RepID=A0AAU8WNK4_9VIBR|nr:hypothetical protein CEQ48_01685 [Vibrio tarriae]
MPMGMNSLAAHRQLQVVWVYTCAKNGASSWVGRVENILRSASQIAWRSKKYNVLILGFILCEISYT